MKIVLSVLLMLGLAGLSQAQTKDETLEWLKNNSTLAMVQVKVRDLNALYPSEKMKPSQIVLINADSIKISDNWNGGKFNFNEFLYEEDVDKLEKEYMKDDSLYSWHGAFWLIVKLSKNRLVLYYTTPEKEADVKRVLKAIMHAAKLSGAKENKHIF